MASEKLKQSWIESRRKLVTDRHRRVALLAVSLLFVASQVFGQSAEIFVSRGRRCTPQGCVSASIGRGMSVNVGRAGPNTWIYVTAAHNFDMQPDRICVGVSGKWVAAKLIGRNKGDDIALLSIHHAGDLKCASLANSGASGDHVFFHRRGGRRASGTIKSSVQLTGVQPVKGDSGAAIYNSDGDVAGIVRGYSAPGTTFYSPAHKVRRLILSTLGKLPVCGDDPQDDPPLPPKEAVAPSHDHSEILNRLSALEDRTPFDSSGLVAENQQLRSRIVKLGKRISELERADGRYSNERVTAIIDRAVADKFRHVSGELNIRVRPDRTTETR